MRLRRFVPAALLGIICWSCEIDVGAGTKVQDYYIVLRPIQAAANPCATPQGYLIFCCPKPCPVINPTAIGVEAQQLTTEISKLTSQIQQYQQWLAALQGIGSQITGLAAKFMSLPGSITGTIKGLAQIPSVSLPSQMGGVNLSNITSIKNSLSSLFNSGGSSPATIQARQNLLQDSAVLASATGMNGRSVQSTVIDDANKLLTAVKSATNTREDLAARNAITMALLQSLQTASTLTSTLNQLHGIASLFSAGDNSTGAQSVAINYAAAPPAVTVPTAPSLQQLAAAVTAIESAVDMHNGVVASTEMQQAAASNQSIIGDYQQKQQLANNALQGLAAALAPYYVDPQAAANAMLTAGAASVTAPWPDIYNRVGQETTSAQAITYIASEAPSTYGAVQCQDVSCSTQISQVVATLLPNLLDANNQASWYSQFNNDAVSTQQTIQNETQSLSTTFGVDFTNPAAVQGEISSAIQTAQANISAAQTDPAITQTSLDQISSIQKAIFSLQADPNNQYYLPYDSTIADPAPNSATAAASN